MACIYRSGVISLRSHQQYLHGESASDHRGWGLESQTCLITESVLAAVC